MSDLDGPGFQACRLHEPIVDFYQHTAGWRLELWSRWSSTRRSGGCGQHGPAAARSTSELAHLEQVIAVERERASARIEALTRQFDAIVESSAIAPPDDEHDPEGSTVAFERAQVATLVTSARSRLAELEQAQQRLVGGWYGSCERCGQRIPVDRLLARPMARMCVACAATDRLRRA